MMWLFVVLLLAHGVAGVLLNAVDIAVVGFGTGLLLAGVELHRKRRRS